MEKWNDKEMFDYADQFINLANALGKSDRSGKVGTALRFAAARFSAYEASTQTKELSQDKDKYIQLIVDDFNKMLQFNFDDYIRILSSKK